MDTFFKIEIMATDMDIILNITNKEWECNADSTSLVTNINSLISAFDKLNENLRLILEQYPQNNLKDIIDELAEYFKDIICYCELNESNLIEDILLNKLIPQFNEFRKDLGEYFFHITAVKKVAIDIDCLSVDIGELMDFKRCGIIGIISNDSELQGKYIQEIPIFMKHEIHYINYDYLVTLNDYSMYNQQGKGIICINDYLKCYYNYEVFRAYCNYSNCKKSLDGFITGLSYAEVGIDTAQLSYNIANLAVSSQDLFYDYQWAKMILNHDHEVANDIKFAIIGLSYYSFEYDLSKSNSKNMIHYYYPFFSTTRNYHSNQEIINNYNKFEQVASEIFKKDYNNIFHHRLEEKNKCWYDDMVSGIMDEEQIEKDKWIVERDCNKNYPETVQENIEILEEYISLLKSKKIKPIIVVCPTNENYYANFSPRIKEEFKDIIDKIKSEFNVEVLDYFDSNVFFDEDFYNVSHLNKRGSMKFTKLLNDKLKNIL